MWVVEHQVDCFIHNLPPHTFSRYFCGYLIRVAIRWVVRTGENVELLVVGDSSKEGLVPNYDVDKIDALEPSRRNLNIFRAVVLGGIERNRLVESSYILGVGTIDQEVGLVF